MNNMQHLSGMNLSSVQHMSGISDMSATIDDHLSDERKMADEPPLSTVNSNPAAASLVEHELQLTKRMHEDWCRCLVVNLHRDAPSFTIQPEMAQQFPFTEEMKTAVENRSTLVCVSVAQQARHPLHGRSPIHFYGVVTIDVAPSLGLRSMHFSAKCYSCCRRSKRMRSQW